VESINTKNEVTEEEEKQPLKLQNNRKSTGAFNFIKLVDVVKAELIKMEPKGVRHIK